jgi:hypothetical protein
MTLELAQASAPSVLAAIQEHTGKTEVAAAASAAAPTEERPAVKPAPAPVKVASAKPINDPNDRGAKASPATKPGSDWWGDDVWKTTRNAPTWTKPTGTIAPEE